MKSLLETHRIGCMYFVAEEKGSLTMAPDSGPSDFGVPGHMIDKLSPGCKPYEIRRCDAVYEPDGEGGCKNFREGRLMIGGTGLIGTKPMNGYLKNQS